MAFILGGTLIAGGLAAAGGIGGALIGSHAAGEAADKQSAAANYATDIQKQIYDQQRSDQQPWRQAGIGALSQLQDPSFQHNFSASDFQTDPGYQFRMQQGQQALERSAAARGGLQSGGTMKAITDYGQNFASNEYQNAYSRFTNDQSNRFNRLSSIAGLGQTANAQNGAAGQNYANNAGANAMGAANASGAAGIAGANAWGGALSSLGQTGASLYGMNMANNWGQRTNAAMSGGSGFNFGGDNLSGFQLPTFGGG